MDEVHIMKKIGFRFQRTLFLQSAPALALPSLSHLLCIPDHQHLRSIGNLQGYESSRLRRTFSQILCSFVTVPAFRLRT